MPEFSNKSKNTGVFISVTFSCGRRKKKERKKKKNQVQIAKTVRTRAAWYMRLSCAVSKFWLTRRQTMWAILAVCATVAQVYLSSARKLRWKSNLWFKKKSKFRSVQSLGRLGRRGDMMNDSAEILSQSFLQEALVSSSGMGRDVCHLMFSVQHFLCRPQRRPLSKVPWRWFWGGCCQSLFAVVTCDMHKPGKFTSLDSCQKRFLWTYKEIGPAPYLVNGLVLQVDKTTLYFRRSPAPGKGKHRALHFKHSWHAWEKQ